MPTHIATVNREVRWLLPLSIGEPDKLLLFSACDSKYLRYAISLIRSAELFSPGFPFVLHLVNPDLASLKQVEEVAASLKKTRLSVSYEVTDLEHLNSDQKRAYYASARFLQIAELLKSSTIPVFSLDADTLVVNSIDLNFTDKLDADVVLVRRDLEEEAPEHLAILTGSIWSKPSAETIKFYEHVAKELDHLLRTGNLPWFIDQIIFYRQMQKSKKTVHFYNLKRKYADWDFKEDSIFWAGKGSRKENDLRFFLLQSLLSHDEALRGIASQLWSTLKSTDSDIAKSAWFRARMDSANDLENLPKMQHRVALIVPRLDLPWNRSTDRSIAPPTLKEDVLDLRLHWKRFSVLLANAMERAGLTVDIHELPTDEIDCNKVDNLGATLALIPHRCHLDYTPGKTPVLFYMQEYFQWLFIVDHRGWSAAASCYPICSTSLPADCGDSFKYYRTLLLDGKLGSKFAQSPSRNRRQLMAEGSIPSTRRLIGPNRGRPYIFFPLQIPHDQSIRYFSDLAEIDIVESIVTWARKNDIAVVMKPHPANRKSMATFEQYVDNQNIFWSEANIYDLIHHSVGVYTVNSGVGLEALLHLKPVVTFGKVEYDCVTFKAGLDTLDEAWNYCQTSTTEVLERHYSQFLNWFLGCYAVDMTRPDYAQIKLDQIASDIAGRVSLISEQTYR
ncbi:MAG TPA: hypothetical protein VFM32_00635 [Spongiibacteraceae bacterium]|nr:hypothetical protein [Spongiibacteraceae bacterium]